jgi:hypothetical protein
MLMFSSDFQPALVSFGLLQSNSLFAGEILDGFGIYQRVLTGSVLFQPFMSILAGSDIFLPVLLCLYI